MDIYFFVFNRLKKNLKVNLLYLISIIFPIVIIFNLMNVINNSNLFVNSGIRATNSLSQDIIFLLVLLVCIFTFYSNSYFVMSKTKEMGIMELSGSSSGKLAKILLFENTIIELLGGAIGILIGIATEPLFLLIMYNVLKKSGHLWMISPTAIWGTIAILLLQLGYVTLGDYSYASSREIIDLLNAHKQVQSQFAHDSTISISFSQFFSMFNLKKKNTVKKSKTFNLKIDKYLIVYLSSIILIFLCPKYINLTTAAIIGIAFTIYGIPALLMNSIPQKILKLKKEKYLDDKIKLVSLSNLYVSLKQLKFLLITLALTIEILLFFIATSDSPSVKTVCVISYITVIILIAGSILYKTIIESNKKSHTFIQLSLIGYTSKQIDKIIKDEFKIYYSIVMALPLFQILIFFILFSENAILSPYLLSIMLCSFLLVFFAAAIISYRTYKKLVFQKGTLRFL